MSDFFRRALKKVNKLDTVNYRELLYSAVNQIELLETVGDSIDVGIVVCDKEHNLVYLNKCAKRLFPVHFIEGVKIWQAIPDEKIVEFFREILLGKDKIADKELEINQKGRDRLYSVNVVPLVQKKRITGSLVYIEDITDKRREEEKHRRAENLASLTTLAAGVAHEIKNPLGSISIHLQLLQKSLAKNKAFKNDKNDKYIKVLKEEVDRLNRIVVDFLFAVRPMNLELRKEDLNKLIYEVMDFVRFEMEQSNILCLLELDDNIPALLLDERYMKQAVLNLITNAKAAMPEGGVLTIASKLADNEIKISVCDTGLGIKKEDLLKIFEPYFTTRETGTGLGLTQVYKIIREHNGEISVDSEPGTGSDFRIILPVPQKDMRLIAYNDDSNGIGKKGEAK